MQSTFEPVSLLLVDDRPENLTALRAILESPEYHLVTAQSGNEALLALENEDFALVMLDVAMPDMSGFDVANHMQNHERTRHVPILFLTGIATRLDQIYRAYAIGAVDYLIKPLDVGAVRAKAHVFADLFRQKQAADRRADAQRDLLDALAVPVARLRAGLTEGRDPAALTANVDAIERAIDRARH